MAILFPRPFPDAARLPLSRIDLSRTQVTSQTQAGAVQVMDVGDPLWTGRFATEPLLWSHRRRWGAWARSLQEGMGTFLAYDWLASFPIAHGPAVLSLPRAATGTLFDGSATLSSWSAETLTLTGLPAGYTATAGDRLSFGWNSTRSYHEVTQDEVASSAGVLTVRVQPQLPSNPAPSIGEAVALVRAPIVMKLRAGTWDEPDGSRKAAVSFEAVQCLTPVYQPEVLALRNRMATPPDGTRLGLINAVIYNLKGAGLWDKLDAFWLMAAHTPQAACLNWKGEAYTLTPVNSPIFVANAGYGGDGVAAYLRTGFYGARVGTRFQQNSASMGVTLQGADTAGGGGHSGLIGCTDTLAVGGSAGSRLMARYRNGSTAIRMAVVNDASNSADSGPGLTVPGSFIVSRTSATQSIDYVNAMPGTAHISASLPVSLELFLLADNFNGTPQFLSPDRISAAFIGASLTAAEVQQMHLILYGYLNLV